MTRGTIALSDRIAIGARAILWFLLAVLGLLGLPVALAWPGPLLGGATILALLLAALLTGGWWLLKGRRRRGARPGRAYVRTVIALLLASLALVGAPVYWFSFEVNARPSALPQVTLSNGRKTVVYQAMVHVGSEAFYKSVVYDLEKALSEGYTLFYEGVQPSPGEGDRWFSEYLAGGGDLSANYRMLGSVCELQFQLDYFGLLAPDMKAHPERHVAADVTTLDMKREFERLAQADPAFAARVKKRDAVPNDPKAASPDPLDVFMGKAAAATPEQRNILGILCRGVVNLALADSPGSGALEPVVLDFRNRNLAGLIARHPAEKIYITYGAAHLPGVIALLRAQDPAWRVVSTKWQRAVGTPEHLSGTLALPK